MLDRPCRRSSIIILSFRWLLGKRLQRYNTTSALCRLVKTKYKVIVSPSILRIWFYMVFPKCTGDEDLGHGGPIPQPRVAKHLGRLNPVRLIYEQLAGAHPVHHGAMLSSCGKPAEIVSLGMYHSMDTTRRR
jgi:hypothetical protein